jgi:hypothetical protein
VITREINTENLKSMGIADKNMANDVHQIFTDHAAEITNTSQAFKQQRRPNVFRSKTYNLACLTEAIALLTTNLITFKQYHQTLDAMKFIQASDLAIPNVKPATIKQHQKNLNHLEQQVRSAIKITMDELDDRIPKLYNLANTVSQRLAKHKPIDRLIANWKEQAPYVEKILAMQDKQVALNRLYYVDEQTKLKLINHLNELAGIKQTFARLTEQINTAKSELNPQLIVSKAPMPVAAIEPAAAVAEPIRNAGEPERLQTMPTKTVPVGTLSYEQHPDYFKYARPKNYQVIPVSKNKIYSADEKLVLQTMARNYLKERMTHNDKTVYLDGNKDMARKTAIWLLSLNENLTVMVNDQHFKPTLREKIEIKQKRAAEPKHPSSDLAADTNRAEKQPLSIRRRN